MQNDEAANSEKYDSQDCITLGGAHGIEVPERIAALIAARKAKGGEGKAPEKEEPKPEPKPEPKTRDARHIHIHVHGVPRR